MEITPLLTTDDRASLRRWLEEHHQKERAVWVTTYRSKQPLADALPYVEAAGKPSVSDGSTPPASGCPTGAWHNASLRAARTAIGQGSTSDGVAICSNGD